MQAGVDQYGESGALSRSVYQAAVTGRRGCAWGRTPSPGDKQEATATWFGLLLPDGSRLGGVDALTELWTGKPPTNRCPVIRSLKLTGPAEVEPGTTVTATLDASDPDG